LISLTLMPKISVTKDNGTYGKASRVVIYPCCAWSLQDPASMTLMELIRRVKESMRDFFSTLVCSRISRKIQSRYLIYFEAGKPPFTASSSALTDGGSHSKEILTCRSICNSSARRLWSVPFIEMLGRRMSSRPVCLMLRSSIQVCRPSGGCKEVEYCVGVQLDVPVLDSGKEHVIVPGMREKAMQRLV
jgi:hypothetical protein